MAFPEYLKIFLNVSDSSEWSGIFQNILDSLISNVQYVLIFPDVFRITETDKKGHIMSYIIPKWFRMIFNYKKISKNSDNNSKSSKKGLCRMFDSIPDFVKIIYYVPESLKMFSKWSTTFYLACYNRI